MNKINIEDCLIIAVDIQEKLVNMLNDGNQLVKEAQKVLKAGDILNLPIIITEQYPKGLGDSVEEIKSSVKNAQYIEKNSFSIVNEDNILNLIKKYNKKQIIIFGIETHICVLQSAIDLLNNGFEVFVVRNASASRNINEHNAAIRRLIHFGAQIVTVEMVIFQLLKSSRHAKFKEIQNLIK